MLTYHLLILSTYFTKWKLGDFATGEVAIERYGDENEHDDKIDGATHNTLRLGPAKEKCQC